MLQKGILMIFIIPYGFYQGEILPEIPLTRNERAILLTLDGANEKEKIKLFLRLYYPKWYKYLDAKSWENLGTKWERAPITLYKFRKSFYCSIYLL